MAVIIGLIMLAQFQGLYGRNWNQAGLFRLHSWIFPQPCDQFDWKIQVKRLRIFSIQKSNFRWKREKLNEFLGSQVWNCGFKVKSRPDWEEFQSERNFNQSGILRLWPQISRWWLNGIGWKTQIRRLGILYIQKRNFGWNREKLIKILG